MKHRDFDNNPPSDLWIKKAMAFLIRTEHQLWGKHSEDVLAELFILGFKNSFIKEQMFGWNKKLTLRSCESWGIQEEKSDSLVLGEGIVIPCIKNKTLMKLFISGYDEKGLHETVKIPGSIQSPVFWQCGSDFLFISDDMLLSCYLYQEYGKNSDVMNLCGDEIGMINRNQAIFDHYKKIFVFKILRENFEGCDFLSDKFIFSDESPFEKKFDFDSFVSKNL